jgi:PAS domain S-box-containing protein
MRMRADTFAFEDVFLVDASSSRISMGSNRYILLNAAAVGSMRTELLDNLGLDIARGIFERIGYQCGRHDARQFRKRRKWENDEDLLRAGLRLHRLEGMAGVSLSSVEIDRAQHKLNAAGEWLDSFEAEQQLQQFGIGNRSACWLLEGYASGYASECLGEDAICLESACRAKGDHSCRFEIRPLSEWGQDGKAIQSLLTSARYRERFDRCLKIISDMGCELEQTSLDAVFTTDAQGIITSCSQGAGELLGMPPGKAIGTKIDEFYFGGSSEAQSITERLKEQRRVRNYLTEFSTPEGRKTPVALSASAIRDRAGNFAGTIGVAHDLSEIRRLEDELSQKNRFMANILRDSADAIITMDPNDIITSWNKGAESMFGFLANEMIGKSIDILLPPDLREAGELETISRSFRAQGAVLSHQTERLTKDGRRIQIIFTRTAIRDDSGRLIGSSSVAKDIISLRSLERQLADTEHLATLGELSAGLAHEIKNPLAGIKGAIDVMRDALPTTDVHREILGDVIHEVNRINKTVQDLLNYAKPRPPSHASIEFPMLVSRMVAIARAHPKHRAITIEVRQLNEIPEFTGDEMQLEQVIINLLLNAQNAVKSGGRIDIISSYDPSAALIRIEVNDNGQGIPEEIRKKIFQPFFTTRTDGSGLGLATCLKNVQYHGGVIEARSEADHGTSFIVTIPLLCYI